MVKLKAAKTVWVGEPAIIITEGSFEHLLNCLDNQKFIEDVNADSLDTLDSLNGADIERIQNENQGAIDGFNRQCRELLNGT